MTRNENCFNLNFRLHSIFLFQISFTWVYLLVKIFFVAEFCYLDLQQISERKRNFLIPCNFLNALRKLAEEVGAEQSIFIKTKTVLE